MVVKFLQTFMERNVPGGFEPVSLVELIAKYKDENEEPPIIVMDGSSLVANFHGNLNTICNGSLKELQQKLIRFHDKIESLGAKLVVFLQGSGDYETESHWVEKRLEKLNRVHECFDKLYYRQLVLESPLQLTSEHMCVKNTLVSLPNCDVFYSVDEVDEAIVQYISQQKVLCVLGQDSDYLIYNGVPLFISLNNLNLETLGSHAYVQAALAKFLHLNISQLPLLASLMGNEIISYDDVLKFHLRLINERRDNVRGQQRPLVFQKVAKYVNSFPHVINNCDFAKIAQDVFNNGKFVDALRSSVDMYRTLEKHDSKMEADGNLARIVEIATELKKACKISQHTHLILTKNTLFTNNDMEDFRRTKYPSAARLLRPLRWRIYGILLFDSDCDTVTEHCVEGIRSSESTRFLLDKVIVHAEKPRVHHPGLLQLWSSSSPELDEVKWTLFCDAVSDKLQPEQLKSLPSHLVFPTAALFYMQQEGTTPLLADFELNAFVIVALKLGRVTIEELKTIKIPLPDPQAIELSAKFLRCVFFLELLNDSCGSIVPNPETCPSKYFDGKLFQQSYTNFRSGVTPEELLGDDITEVALFNLLIEIIALRT